MWWGGAQGKAAQPSLYGWIKNSHGVFGSGWWWKPTEELKAENQLGLHFEPKNGGG